MIILTNLYSCKAGTCKPGGMVLVAFFGTMELSAKFSKCKGMTVAKWYNQLIAQ
jgi:hypothetical protein